MHAVTYSEARANFAAILDKVNDDHAPVLMSLLLIAAAGTMEMVLEMQQAQAALLNTVVLATGSTSASVAIQLCHIGQVYDPDLGRCV
jgi:1-aminocyclopropane-1-carboxylate deaminase/D-cysteine desulfhydrase-like pyridoxal-dependent ACC family enzyme